MFTRTEVVEPPYIAPYHTPVIMMSPVVAPYGIVNGSSSAIVAVGPSPGSTPTTVPISAPTKHATRFAVVNEFAKPLSRSSQPLMRLLSPHPNPLPVHGERGNFRRSPPLTG